MTTLRSTLAIKRPTRTDAACADVPSHFVAEEDTLWSSRPFRHRRVQALGIIHSFVSKRRAMLADIAGRDALGRLAGPYWSSNIYSGPDAPCCTFR